MDPSNSPPLPLVELPPALNPFASEGVHIFAKCMYLLPLLNLKSLPALRMLYELGDEDTVNYPHTLVENSSGNTAFSLGILARIFGIKNVTALVPWDIAQGKIEMLRLAGVEPRLTSEKTGEQSGIAKAREMGEQPGWMNLGQYENEANPLAHEQWTAKQIWEQTQGKLTIFCAGMGTTGTIIGARDFFAKQNARVVTIGVSCAPNHAVPGVRSQERLKEVSFDWQAGIVRAEATTRESYQQSLALCRAGILGGPSSGLALAGLLAYLKGKQNRSRAGETVAAFICADTPFPYLDKYSTQLEGSDF